MYTMNYLKPYKYTAHPVICHHLKPYMYINCDLAQLINSLCKKNYLYLTYTIGSKINYHLSITCNTFVIVMEYKTVDHFINNSGEDSRPVHGIKSLVCFTLQTVGYFP